MSQWKPINTAPRNGRTILAYLPANAGLETRQDVVAIYWAAGGGWVTAYSGACLDAEPTYWMPLPEAPAAIKANPTRDNRRPRQTRQDPDPPAIRTDAIP